MIGVCGQNTSPGNLATGREGLEGNFTPAEVPIAGTLQQWPEWKRAHPRLCSTFPRICLDDTPPAFKITTMALADLHEDMLGIGSAWFVPAVLLCAACGLMAKPEKSAELAAAEDMAPASRREDVDRCIDWWGSGPRVTPKALKAFVAALLLIELLGLTVPQTDVFTLPEVLRRVRAHPYGSQGDLGFGQGFTSAGLGLMPRLTYLFMPGLSDATADGYAAAFAIVRLSVLASWCAFLALPTSAKASRVCFTWGAVFYVLMASLGHLIRVGF